MGETMRHGFYKTYLVDSSGNEVAVNQNNLAIIDIAHKEIHEGEYYQFCTKNSALALSATVDILFMTGAKQAHVVFNLTTVFETIYTLYRDCSATAITTLTASNANDNYRTNVPTMQHATTFTVANTGTAWIMRGLGYNGTPSSSPNQTTNVRAGQEIVFAPNTKYLFRVVNNGASNTVYNCFEWYEH